MKGIQRLLIALLILLVPVLGFAGGAQQAATPQQDGVVELTVWFGRQDFIPDDNFAAFHQRYPNIRVRADVIPLEQVLTEAATAISAGVGPDIIQTDSRRLPPLVEGNLLMPMNEYIERWRREDPDNYNALSSSAWEHATQDGNIYGVTVFSGPFNHVYRLDWLREAGLSVPTNWEEVLNVARALNNPPGRRGYSVRGPNSSPWFFSHYMAMGGTFDENNIIQLDSEAGIYALRFYQTLVRDRLVSDDVLAWGSGEMRAAFITGRAAQAPIGTNIFPSIQAEMKYGEQWAAIPPPPRRGAEAQYQYASLGWPSVVTANTRHPYEASLVLRYLAEHQQALSVARRYQPTTVTTVWNDPEYLAQQPWSADFDEALRNMTRTPATLFITQVDQIVLDALGEVMSNVNANPAEVARRYQQQLNALAR